MSLWELLWTAEGYLVVCLTSSCGCCTPTKGNCTFSWGKCAYFVSKLIFKIISFRKLCSSSNVIALNCSISDMHLSFFLHNEYEDLIQEMVRDMESKVFRNSQGLMKESKILMHAQKGWCESLAPIGHSLGCPECSSPREHPKKAWRTAGIHKTAPQLRDTWNHLPRDVASLDSPGLLAKLLWSTVHQRRNDK